MIVFNRNCVWGVVAWMAIGGVAPVASAVEWQSHAVRQLNGAGVETSVAAKIQVVTEDWNRVVAVPYMTYMPETDRLLMTVGCDYPHQAMVITSDDHGTTWSSPRYLHTNAVGNSDAALSTGLTYLGNGRLMASQGTTRWQSSDYGNTWAAASSPVASNGSVWYEWDPMLVDKDAKTENVTRLMSFCSDNMQPDGHFQGYVRFSSDQGLSWSNEIKVPQMYRVNETAFVRAANGDIVAACRTDNPDQFAGQIDHYGGLAVSISKDDGSTWSSLNTLYDFGRHHASMVLMPNNDIVMTYVVRKGYPDTPEGFPQFGVEALVSHDNGQSWDLDHRYILDSWVGSRPSSDSTAWWPSSQSTSTLLMPDGSLLTAFGTGYRVPGTGSTFSPRDVAIVQWRLSEVPEPSTIALVGWASIAIGGYVWQRRRQTLDGRNE
jgi:hypothetical protein